MNIQALWIARDPGLNRLKIAMGGMSAVVFTLLVGVFALHAKPLTLVFAALIATISFLRLYGQSARARMRSAVYAGGMLLAGTLIGLWLPKIFWVDLSVLLSAVFIAFYLLNYGAQFAFHPAVAVVLMLLGTFMQVPVSDESPFYLLVMLSVLSWSFHFLIYFFVLRESALFGVRHQVYSVLCVLQEVLMCVMTAQEREASHALARAHRMMNQWQLTGADPKIALRYETARVKLYGMLRISALLMESHQQIHHQFALAKPVLDRVHQYEQIVQQEFSYVRAVLLGKPPHGLTEHLPARPVLALVDAFEQAPPIERLLPLYNLGFAMLRLHELLEDLKEDAHV